METAGDAGNPGNYAKRTGRNTLERLYFTP